MKITRTHMLFLFTALLLVVFAGLTRLQWISSVHFHTIVEVVATLLAAQVGILSLLRFYSKKNNTFLFIGTGFIGTAFLDGYHAVVTSEYFHSEMPSAPDSLIVWSWNASRLYLSVLLLISWWAWKREKRMGENGQFNELTVYVITFSLMLISFFFFAFVPLPPVYYPNFIVGRPEELIIGIVFIITLIGYWNKSEWKTDWFEYFVLLSLVLGTMCQLVVMPFSYTLFDPMFDIAHFLKKLSYIMVLTGLLVSIYQLFVKEQQYTLILKQNRDVLLKEIESRKIVEDSLTKSKQEIEDFSYSISHDLRAPIRHMNSYLQLLHSRIYESIDDKSQHYLTMAIEASDKMSKLIDKLLKFFRLGRLTCQKKWVDLNETVSEVLSGFQSELSKNNCKVDCNSLPDVYADQNMIWLVLTNLIDNAIKFSSKQENSMVTVGYCGDDPEYETLFVRDNGVGFDMNHSKNLFQMFHRLHTKDEFEGIGSGLANVKRIVSLHGGRCWAESKRNKGTTIYFTIPKTRR